MKTMPAGKFKTHCLSVLDEVAESRQEVVVTKRGKPVAKIVPMGEEDTPKEGAFGWMRGTCKIVGDIVGPHHDVWNVDGITLDPSD